MKNILVSLGLICVVLAMVPMVQQQSQADEWPNIFRIMLGDVNCDGSVCGTTSDCIMLLNWLNYHTFELPCEAACDIDGNGWVEYQDAIHLFDICFYGAEPPELFGSCEWQESWLPCSYTTCDQ